MCYEVLVRISPGYPSVTGRLHTRYSPVRRSPSVSASWYHVAPRLACVRPVASVHPEPGSNSSLYYFFFSIIPSKTLPSLPLRERLAIRRFWRWLFLLVSYYFVYHSLKDLSLFPHRFSRSAYRLFPKSECKDRAFLFPYQIFLLLFFIFFLLKSTTT